MTFDAAYILVSLKVAIRFLHVTLLLSVIPLAVGIAVGTPIAVCRKFRVRAVSQAANILIPVLKGIPLVLYVLILNFLILKPLDRLAPYYAWADRLRVMDKIYIGIAAMSAWAAVTISETMRSALNSVPAGQYEACFSVGLTRTQALRRIIMPQALKFAVPVLCNNFIGLIKGSSIVYVIGILDILGGAMTSAQINYRFLEAYIAAALIYWMLCLTVERVSWRLEKRFKLKTGG
ncbi:MAG: amino acid ABC transporter permease [Synergistaceae bacterium]|jgi:L-cystine transport system permease protein|nr:amino acid ABC transporter permease [Synergistaceae bacterium]